MNQGSQKIDLYSCKAHVFFVDKDALEPGWIPKRDKAINVTFRSVITEEKNGPAKRELMIVATDDEGTVVLKDIIRPKTVFKKRTHKFCQWVDDNGTLCGLGFEDNDLVEFMETFENLRTHEFMLTQTQPTQRRREPQTTHNEQQMQQSQNVFNEVDSCTMPRSSVSSGYLSNTMGHVPHRQTLKRAQQQENQPNQTSQQISTQQHHNLMNGNSLSSTGLANLKGENMPTSNAALGFPKSQSSLTFPNKPMHNGTLPRNRANLTDETDGHTKEQLRLENERLKQALEENSSNAETWQNELITLRANNFKLTQALQESKANVGEWQRELTSLRKENETLRNRVSSFESGGGDLTQKYKNDLLELQVELSKKDKDIEKLKSAMDELALSKQRSDDQLNNNITNSISIDQQLKEELTIIQDRLSVEVAEFKKTLSKIR